MSLFFPHLPRRSPTARAWVLQVSEPYATAALLRACQFVRFALLNAGGMCYIEFEQPVRHHYVEQLCAGHLLSAQMKPVAFHRDSARALVERAGGEQWELGEWRAGGQGARSELIPFYRVAVQDGASDSE